MRNIVKGIITITIAITLVVSVMIPFLNVEEGHVWTYDDYVISSEYGTDPTVGGVFELVTVGDTQYIHAKGVGDGTINNKAYYVSKAKLDVILMTGQSNGAYRNADPNLAPTPELGTAYYFGLYDRYAGSNPTPLLNLDECEFWPMLNENGENRVGNKAPSLCKEYYALTGHKVYFVDSAIDSQTIQTFLPGNSSWEYSESLFEKAMSLIDDDLFEPSYGNYIWIQGESNSNTPVSAYASAFIQMNNAMLNGSFGGYKFKHCFVSQVAYGNSISALESVSNNYDTVSIACDLAKDFTTDNGLMGSDNLHYTQAGNNLIGTELGMYLGNYVSPDSYDFEIVPTLLALIPILAIIGIIVGAIVYLINRRS